MDNKTMMLAGDFSPEAYNTWAKGIFYTIESAKLQASLKLNADLLQLYHTIGKEILEKQELHGWGAQVIDLLSSDLQKRYKGESGYSSRNLGYMKGFAKQYPDFPILQVPLAKLDDKKNDSIWQASLAKLDEDEKFVQVPLAQIPWYHHISLISKVKDVSERAFYILKTAENGWSRDIMLLQVDNDLYKNYGKALNNFSATLPEYHSDLARDIFKDPYKFGFLAIEEKVNERMIEEKLIQKITDFLLEMGKGFAFVGHQYHLEVEEDDYYVDILMYHLKLHCYVAIELKAVEFIPEFISKLNFYVSAIDDQVKTTEDNPTIGLIIAGFLIRLNILDALPKYVYFQTLAKRYKEWVLSESARTGQPGFNLEQYNSFEIPIPKNTDEQTAIATALSDIDTLIAALDKKITKKQQIKQGAMQQLLTCNKRLPGFSGAWVEKTIGQSLTIKHGKNQEDIEDSSGRYPILGTGGIMSFTNIPLYSKQSVLIGRKGTIDKPYFYDTPFWTVDTLFYSEIREDYCAKFIFYKFNQIDWYAYNEASGVPSLNAKVIESIVIAFPPTLAEQTAIAKILTDMDNEITQLETDLNKYKQIKAGMMQQLLTGKIRLVN